MEFKQGAKAKWLNRLKQEEIRIKFGVGKSYSTLVKKLDSRMEAGDIVVVVVLLVLLNVCLHHSWLVR